MQKMRLAGFGMLLLLAACAQEAKPNGVTPLAATELLFSEYLEGSSFNKALELYNGTGVAVDLSAYRLEVYSNGSATPSQALSLSGSLADGEVYVLAHPSADAAILGVADVTSGSVINFNGDDALVLRKGAAVIDVIGQIGTDPGTEWGTGLTSTADNTLRRKAAVCAGDTNGADAFDPAPGWDGFEVNVFSGLGSHAASCDGPTEDAPPTVVSTTPADAATGVALDGSVAMTFSEPVTVTETGVSLVCSGETVAFTGTLNEAGTVYTLEPSQNLARAETCTVTLAAEAVTDRDGAPDVLAAPYSFSFTTLGAVTRVHAVQGISDSSPLVGQTVTVEGVVVGDFEGASPALRGFYVQEEAADQDSDPATSEGLFVFNGNANSVSVGQSVSVTGAVSEFGGQTQLAASTVEVLASGTVPQPLNLTLPLPAPVGGVPYLERFEGMFVRFPQRLVIAEYFNYDRFGEVVLAQPPSGLARPYTPTSYVEPGSEAAAVADLNARSRMTLDDASTAQNPEVTRHPNAQPFSLTNRFRGGDTVTGATGILAYGFDLYRVQPTQGAEYAVQNPRSAAPEPVGGSLKVASFNVLNYFTTLTSEDENARGADTPEEFARQQAKIVAALRAIDADIFGLIEIENNGDTAVANLTEALNAAVGAGTYTYIPTGVIGTDAIKVALVYKPAKVAPAGAYAILDSSDDPRFIDTANRPVLIQTFDNIATGGRFTLAVNHLKSKGSECGAGDDDPQQGNCNATRTQAAAALADHLATDPTASGDPDFLLVGDLNAYDEEDPIRVLEAEGYTDLNERFGGEFAYSYAFDGQLGYLDYALSSASLTDQVTGTTEWHINADEPDLLDYDMSFKSAGQDAIYAPDPYRASDHDPVVVGLELTVPDPAELLAALIAEVEALGLGRGDEQKLLAQLEAAERHLGRAQVALADAALARFEAQVANLARKGSLTAGQVEALLEASSAIRALL